jgi:Cd2+/Zn2+-exporting ATPase
MEERMDATCSCEGCAGNRTRAGCEDREGGEERFSLKRELIFLGAAAVLFGLGLLSREGGWLRVGNFAAQDDILFILAYILAGHDVLLGAVRNIVRGRIFDELFLMSIATLGAIAIGRYEEALGVMVFYKIGEALQESASAKSRSSVRELLALRPSVARLRRDGVWVVLDPAEAKEGDEFMVMPGERVPLDGEVVEGECFVDTSAITGEALPRRMGPGGELFAGYVISDGSLTAIASKTADRSAAARIVELVESAVESKSRTTRLVTRFAAVYTPIVVAAALVLAFLPPLFLPGQSLATWVYRALVLLVISCPCALVVSVPLGYFCGMGSAAKRGILVKGAEVLDSLAATRTVVFDKTGTLTAGEFRVRRIEPQAGFTETEVLALAAAAESRSRHPIAASIRREAASKGPSAGMEDMASDIVERPGAGVAAIVGGRRVTAGNDRLLHLEGVPHDDCRADGTIVNVTVDGALAGRIVVGDEPRTDAATAMSELKRLGTSRVVMLTGDAASSARPIAEILGIAELAADLLPEDKLAYLDRVVAETAATGGSTIFVGDGINDAPALARADVGAAMGGGTDAAVESADLVLMTDEPSRLPEAIARARRTRSIVAQGIALCLAIKLVFLGLGAAGIAQMWEAVLADVGVAILAIFNALRAMR